MANESLYSDPISTPSLDSDIPGLSSVIREYQTTVKQMHRQILDLNKRLHALENRR
jgi:uncharacterized coiled-coil protein SlyX